MKSAALILLLSIGLFGATSGGAGAQLLREEWKTCGDGHRACLQFCAERRQDSPECRANCDGRLEGGAQACLSTGTFRWPVDKPAFGPLEKVRQTSR
ncbi:MAG: hypothetical protein IBJ17_04655 [Reyranella sp.]|nr:hypothetical protein [Reyranella sp.]